MHGVVGVDLLQSHQEALYQVLSVLELDELEGHLAADADNDGVGQQARVLHLLNTYYLEQRWHTRYIKKGSHLYAVSQGWRLNHLQEELLSKGQKVG